MGKRVHIGFFIALTGLGALALVYAGLSNRAAPSPEEALVVAAAPVAPEAPLRAPRTAEPAAPGGVQPGSNEPASAQAGDVQQLAALCPEPRDCACLEQAALAGFERNRAAAALALLREAPPQCRSGALSGIEAEALARAGRTSEAARRAEEVLARDARDRHATQARALLAYRAGQFAEARRGAERALELGRGAAAHLLLGLVEYQSKNFERARQAFDESRSLSPKSPDAYFNLGVLAQRTNHYREARENYLKALSLDPSYLDARYNLVLLTEAHGARDEAAHHYRKLEARAGSGDPRVARLARSFQTLAGSAAAASARELRLRSSNPPSP